MVSTTTLAPAENGWRQRGAPAAPAVGGALLAIAAGFAFAYPLSTRAGTVQLLQYGLVAYASVRAASCVRLERPRLAMLVFWLFVYSVFGIVQIVQLNAHLNPFGVAAPDALVVMQLVILWVGCMSADVASVIAYGWFRPRDAGLLPTRVVSVRRVVVLGILTLVLMPYFNELYGGVGNLFSSRQELVNQLASKQGGTIGGPGAIPAVVSRVLPFIAVLALLLLRLAGVINFKRRLELGLLFAALVAVNLLINNPFTSARYWLATILIALFFVGDWIRKPKWQVTFIASFLAASLVAFPFLDVFRYSVTQERTQSPVYYYTHKTDYGSPQDVVNTLYYVAHNGHTDGRQVLGAVLFFVPRSLWPDKAPNTAELLADAIGFPNPNIDTPLWAEGYIDFGLPGTLVFMGIFGGLAGYGDRLFAQRREKTGVAALLLPALAGYELIVLRGSLLQAMSHLSMIVVLGLLVTRRKPPLSD